MTIHVLVLWAPKNEKCGCEMKFSNKPNLRREPKLSEQAAHFLACEISSGHLESGTFLPSEAELAYRFNFTNLSP